MTSFSQNGFIRGTIYDDATAETLPGVTVFVEGTTLGSITDFDGKFSITVPAGNYTLRVSFISYQTLSIEDVVVTKDESVIFDNLRMKEANIEIEGVVISSTMVRNTETAMLSMKQKSANLMDGISAVNLRKIGDSDAASSMKRVPGVSIQGGKYVFVRGLGDRYTKTILNGMDIPGLDPDRNTLQMDIFPTNVIDNIVVNKSFTADLPADFTGGIVDITTKDFPEEKKASVSVSLGYIPGMHFNSDYLTYEGGKTDWLGFDDGTRAIPATANIPFYTDAIVDPDGPNGLRFREILEGFNPTLAAMKQQSFMDYKIGASVGNQINGKKITWGYNAAISYKNETDYYQDAEFGRYGLYSDISINEMEAREFQVGDYGVNNVLISGLAGLALKTEKSKFRLNFLHLQNGETKAGIFDYAKSNQGTEFKGFQHNLEYGQRSLTNILLNGKHILGNSWNIEWKLSPTFSRMDDPDIRFTRYVVTDENKLVIGTESGFPERIWRSLEEVNYSGVAHINKDFELFDETASLKFGGAYTYKERDFDIKSFALNIRQPWELSGDPNELFYPENLWPREGNIGSGTTYEARFVPTNPNQFNANATSAAGYVSVELSPFNRLKTILGVRLENFTQKYTGQDQLGNNVLDNEKVLDNLDVFPSLNLIYSLNEDQNFRFSFTQTIARPSFKELSFAEIFDPITGRTFVGGLFRDADDVAGLEYWDGNLVSTHISNFDLRWELFQPGGQTISVSAFYKSFKNPIELVQYTTLVGAFQPRNVGDGQVYGLELELRKNFEFISEMLQHFSFNANFTYTKSRIKLSTTEYQSRLNNAREGQTIDDYRDMAGQAPYLINGGISYNGGNDGFKKGLEAGIYYNVQGETLFIVGIVDRPDIYIVPFHSLNINVNKSFGKNEKMTFGIKIENILNDNRETIFKSYKATDQYFTRLNPGTQFTLRFGYRIF
ncbi:MAG: TonB-dependent receptor [Bacteroidales bacterium]|nr:TonB-dependent receptor [Bacteroidales bacterium]